MRADDPQPVRLVLNLADGLRGSESLRAILTPGHGGARLEMAKRSV